MSLPLRAVYLLRCDLGDVWKIGMTQSGLSRRMRDIQVPSPVPIELYSYVEVANPPRIESLLHEKFRRWRQNGEWFRWPPRLTPIVQATMLALTVAPYVDNRSSLLHHLVWMNTHRYRDSSRNRKGDTQYVVEPTLLTGALT